MMVLWWLGVTYCDRFVISLTAVRRQRIAIKLATRNTIRIALHLRKERAIERVIVAVVKKVVSASERRVALELVVTIQTRLTTERGQQRSARCSIAANTQFGCDNVTVGLNSENGQQHGEVVADIVDILLGVDEFVEVRDSVVRQEVVVRCGVQTGARTANIVGSGRGVVVGGVAIGWHLVENKPRRRKQRTTLDVP
jgi:hypothetical protein